MCCNLEDNFCWYFHNEVDDIIEYSIDNDKVLLITHYGKKYLLDFNGKDISPKRDILSLDIPTFIKNSKHIIWGDVISIEKVRNIEKRCNILLPQDYLKFITEVSNGFLYYGNNNIMFALEKSNLKDNNSILIYSSECYIARLLLDNNNYGKVKEYHWSTKDYVTIKKSFTDWFNNRFSVL